MQTILILDATTYKYERIVYAFVDVIADLGGVMDIFLAIFALFFDPYTELAFNTDALSKFYSAKSKNKISGDENKVEPITADKPKVFPIDFNHGTSYLQLVMS